VIYTFYSFKGGVGRSMAMAAVAYLFAQRGLKVLVVDFDLEAPGLERYFFESDQARVLRQHLGLIDLLNAYKKAMTSEAEFSEGRFRRWWDFVDEAVPSAAGGGQVDILTAGCREPEEKLREYALAVRTFDWPDFFANWNGEQFFDWLRKQLTNTAEGAEYPGYDVVLVDSRTGVTEMGGVSAYQLADCAVMLCAANYQNLEGTLAVARDFRSDPVLALRRGRPLELLVIPARLEGSHPRKAEFLAQFADFFTPAEYFPRALADAGLDYAALALPYEPEFAVIERLVGDAEDPATQTARNAVASFERLADALTLLAPAGPGRLYASLGEAQARLTGGHSWAEIVPQVADPTKRSAGFDAYLDAAQADQGVAVRLAAQLEERGLRVVNGDNPSLLVLLDCETLVLLFGAAGSSDNAPRLVASARERKQGAPAILPVLLAAEDDPCPSGRAAARALELERELLCLDPQREDFAERLVAAIRKARPRIVARAPTLERDPYPGGRAFREDEAPFFFGREEEIGALYETVEANPITLLTGPAGVGKSSLVVAGLYPRWRQNFGLEESLTSGELALELQDLPTPAPQAFYASLGFGASRMVVDHADSFPQGGDADSRRRRIEAIGQLTERMGSNARILIVWRGALEGEERELALELWRPSAFFTLDSLAPAAMKQAIERPAGRLGHLFEQGLVQLLVENAGSPASGMAQVQRLLPELWKERKRGWLTANAYNRAGGVAGAFKRAFAEFRAALAPEEKKAAETLLRSLTYFDRNLRLQADFADWQDLATIPDLAEVDATALRDKIAERHFVDLHRGTPSTSEEERTRVGLVFPNPAAYGKDYETAPDPDFLLWRRRLAGQLAGWRQNGKGLDYLLTGLALFEAEDFVQKNPTLLTAAERELIASSVELRRTKDKEQRDAELAKRENQELREAKEEALAERDRALAAQKIADEHRAAAEKAVRRAKRYLYGLITLSVILIVAVYLLSDAIQQMKGYYEWLWSP
jgi:hypothetical protein